MKLLVGLGNPGQKYARTRHNAGFWLLDEIAREAGVTWDESSGKFHGIVGKGDVGGVSCILLKPSTFMNLSGRSVLKAAQFFKVPSTDWIVLHDDIDLPDKKVRARNGGGHGGHNGIRSIMEVTGFSDFHRIKLGVGRPEMSEDGRPVMDVADYVLRPMTQADVDAYTKALLPEVHLRMKDMLKQTSVKT